MAKPPGTQSQPTPNGSWFFDTKRPLVGMLVTTTPVSLRCPPPSPVRAEYLFPEGALDCERGTVDSRDTASFPTRVGGGGCSVLRRSDRAVGSITWVSDLQQVAPGAPFPALVGFASRSS